MNSIKAFFKKIGDLFYWIGDHIPHILICIIVIGLLYLAYTFGGFQQKPSNKGAPVITQDRQINSNKNPDLEKKISEKDTRIEELEKECNDLKQQLLEANAKKQRPAQTQEQTNEPTNSYNAEAQAEHIQAEIKKTKGRFKD